MTTDDGNLEHVGIRDVWPDEAVDFTVWLAGNIAQLGDALDIDLKTVQREAQTGAFSLDILAKDRSDGEVVVIENQLNWTDHDHLGKVLTYAGWHDARILIWVAPRFYEEHRAALEWLNNWTPDEIRVFGVEVHTTKRNASEANLEFVPVVAPKGWSRNGEGKTKPVKLQSVRRPKFFNALIKDLRKKGFESDDYAPPPLVRQHAFHSGISDMLYYAMFEIDGNAWVYIPGGTSNLDALRKDECRQQIKAELASDSETSIDWRTPYSSLGVYRKATLYDSEEELEDIRKWMFRYLLKFKKVFNPRMEKIIEEMENSG